MAEEEEAARAFLDLQVDGRVSGAAAGSISAATFGPKGPCCARMSHCGCRFRAVFAACTFCIGY